MSWALVFMTCFRLCTPQYVELYSTKADCIAAAQAQDAATAKWYVTDSKYCIPTTPGVKNDQKAR